MSRCLVVTGTDTGVGKTVVTAALAAVALAAGQRVAVVKPAQTGATGTGDPGDTETVGRLLGGTAAVTLSTLVTYPEPLAPATAARRSGLAELPLETAVAAVSEARAHHDLVLVEGAGGLLVRMAGDPEWTLVDLAVALAAPVLVVARAGLGTLNHTALTGHVLADRGVEPAGVVIGSWPAEPDLAQRCNVLELPGMGAGPLAGALPEGLGAATDPTRFTQVAARGLAPVLGGTFDAADFTRTNAPEPKAVK